MASIRAARAAAALTRRARTISKATPADPAKRRPGEPAQQGLTLRLYLTMATISGVTFLVLAAGFELLF